MCALKRNQTLVLEQGMNSNVSIHLLSLESVPLQWTNTSSPTCLCISGHYKKMKTKAGPLDCANLSMSEASIILFINIAIVIVSTTSLSL